MKVYAAINAVQADLNKEGISKGRRNAQQGYSFRGIDDVYNALSPLLARHGLCILPRILARSCEERATAKGGVLFYVTVEAEFDFVCAEDGSKHVVRTFGEAMDSADKATNKAMSAAYKYAAFQAFAIPTEGDNDPNAHTHKIVPEQPDPVDPYQDPAYIAYESKVLPELEAAANNGLTALNEAFQKLEKTEHRKMLRYRYNDSLKKIAEKVAEQQEAVAA